MKIKIEMHKKQSAEKKKKISQLSGIKEYETYSIQGIQDQYWSKDGKLKKEMK
ncbi:unnamed protein product [Paramecium octaurelia]|uniref:Uncharacterized protein n=1 Tax=Paramecium octaurelia TaxID=43137 RepID=A0A8S1XC01_PAROT|nr:unnamed protein product [Paramecium octaurelia]